VAAALGAFDHPERPSTSQKTAISRSRKVTPVCFGVVVGAFVAQKLQAPLGLDARDKTAVFWLFFLVIMALLARLFIAVTTLARRRRWR
jgi:hypothetical protein